MKFIIKLLNQVMAAISQLIQLIKDFSISHLLDYLFTHFPKFWKFISRVPFLGAWLNRFIINSIVNSAPYRPHSYSMWSTNPDKVSDYTSWDSLTNRRFSGRYLPPASDAFMEDLPDIDEATELFRRKHETKGERTSVLFMFFAQWFTDSFLRTDPNDFRKNTSNHEIDLCQIYGLKPSTANILRSHEGGKMKSQFINDEEYPPYLYDENLEVKEEFADLPYVPWLDSILSKRGFPDLDERKKYIFAVGLERGNSTVGYSTLNTIFIREHNRIAQLLSTAYPTWNDERLFQTTRNILTVILLKIVVEDYVNHITPLYFPLSVEIGFAEKQPWYRTNWITTEFNLLYRWHSLIPDKISIDETAYGAAGYLLNNKPLIDHSMGSLVTDFTGQAATKVGLFNCPEFLLQESMNAEKASMSLARRSKLASFNDYRTCFGLDRMSSYAELTSDKETQDKLHKMYGHIDNLEFLVGIFAEEGGNRTLFGDLITVMVGVDAFSQALTNPLLAKDVFNVETFSTVGMEIIGKTNTLSQVVLRNTKDPHNVDASFDFTG